MHEKDAEAWVRKMVRETGGGYHPDTVGSDYTHGAPCEDYDRLNSEAYEALQERVYEVACDEHGHMMYDVDEPKKRDAQQVLMNVRHVLRLMNHGQRLEVRAELAKVEDEQREERWRELLDGNVIQMDLYELCDGNDRYKQFVLDMLDEDLTPYIYRGRMFYHGPAVNVEDWDQAMCCIKASAVKLTHDGMGLGYVLYPK